MELNDQLRMTWYIRELEARTKQLREALTSIEFDAGGYCNSCMGWRAHEDDCLVGQVLKGGGE